MKRLDTVVSSLVLRRTKEDINNKTLNLTQRSVHSHPIQLLEGERQVYDILFAEARKVMYHWLQEQGEDVRMNSPPDSKMAAVPSGQATLKAEDTDGAANKPPVPPEVERVVNTIMRPYLIGTAKGRCVLGLLLR